MIGYIQLLLIFSYPDKNFHFFNHFNTNVPGPKHAQKKIATKKILPLNFLLECAPSLLCRFGNKYFMIHYFKLFPTFVLTIRTKILKFG